MKKFAVMAVDIGEGSNFKPKLIALSDSISHAKNAALNYLIARCSAFMSQSGTEMSIDDECLRAADEYGIHAIQISIQPIAFDVQMMYMTNFH